MNVSRKHSISEKRFLTPTAKPVLKELPTVNICPAMTIHEIQIPKRFNFTLKNLTEII